MRKYQITIACDHHEAEQFAAYLNSIGHVAQVGNDTGNYVDGVWTSTDEHANDIHCALWDAYCAA